uniref:Enolase n=1 Tax=Rhizophora mucronata TaxID=61149 RepID=A0A2P2MG40_RHIMU
MKLTFVLYMQNFPRVAVTMDSDASSTFSALLLTQMQPQGTSNDFSMHVYLKCPVTICKIHLLKQNEMANYKTRLETRSRIEISTRPSAEAKP